METLVEFSIPIKGLRDGVHGYKFNIDRTFFSHFEQSPILEGGFEVALEFNKRPEMFELNFTFNGTAKQACDRCLVQVDLPIEGENRLLVKFSEEPVEEDADVVFVSRDISSFNVAKYIYEYICLSLPLINIFECESLPNPPCDQKVLDRLEQMEYPEDTDKGETNSIWDELKDKFN